MVRGVITLYDRRSETIFIHESFGLTEEEKKRGIYALGEGITGKVVESGKVIIVPRLTESADFLDRTGADHKRQNTAFFCVPIMLGQKVLGTIGAERVYMNRSLLKQDAEFLAAIALMIAPAVELFLMTNIDKVQLENENLRLKNALKERYKPSNIIGNSKPMQDDVYELIGKVAATRATVLILGESGVGKELVANAIHYNSANSEGPFIKFNCAAIPENLAESELFGHEKGSFTGALATHKGSFEQADGGSIFLDEVGELSPVGPGQAVARAAGTHHRTDRRRQADQGRRPHHRRHQPRSRPSGWREAISARICSTASTSSPSPCRRCASAAAT